MTALTKGQQIGGFIVWMILAFIAAGFGAAASVHAASFYAQLVSPPWAPPAWVFGPVWTTLYVLMGFAAWLVWRVGGSAEAKPALVLFLFQLVLNALWSWLFFAWHLGAWAFLDVVVLWVLILATVIAFWRVRPIAGVLLVPYFLWVSFALVLNYSVWQLNPALLG